VHLNLHQLINHLKTLRVENQHAHSTLLFNNLISNQHARSSSSFQILVSASTLRDLTLYASTSIIFSITESFFKKLSQLNKIYTIEEQFTNTDNNFDFKLRIFFNKCRRVKLSLHTYMKKASFMFAKRALFHFMIINTKTLHSTNFVTIWRNSLKNQNKSVSI
jgi:hypothetical protein